MPRTARITGCVPIIHLEIGNKDVTVKFAKRKIRKYITCKQPTHKDVYEVITHGQST